MNNKITNLINFVIDLKKEIRNSGRTNALPIRIIEELFNKYKINRKELEKMKNDKQNKD